MASALALYRSLRIGTGTSADPYRSKLANYITGTAGAWFEDWALDPTGALARYALAFCDSAVHTTMAADVDIQQMSPQRDSLSDLLAWLAGPVGTISAGLRTLVEGDGIPIDDFTVDTTRRTVWRRIALRHRMGQFMRGATDTDALAFLLDSLATQVSAIPVARRNRIAAWMTERGLDTSWIVGTTTVREVLRYILLGLNLKPLRWAAVEL